MKKSFYEQGLEVDALLAKAIYCLNNATQTLHSMREEFAKSLILPQNNAKWEFPKNNYSVLVTWLIYDPNAHILFPIHQRKSWAALAEKLTNYVGWEVEWHILSRTYNRKNNKKCKCRQNDYKISSK